MQSIVITDMGSCPRWTKLGDLLKYIGIQYSTESSRIFRLPVQDSLPLSKYIGITIYDIIDHQLFFLSVIKYGITFVDADKYEWTDGSGNLRNRHGIIKLFDSME